MIYYKATHDHFNKDTGRNSVGEYFFKSHKFRWNISEAELIAKLGIDFEPDCDCIQWFEVDINPDLPEI